MATFWDMGNIMTQEQEPWELQSSKPSAIAVATSNSNGNKTKLSKIKVKDIVNKKKRKKNLANYNPLLPESEQLSDDDDDEEQKEELKPTRIHSFILITNTSKMNERAPSRFYNIYSMLIVSNIFLIGSFLLFIHNYIIDAIGILLIIIGFILNIYTIWTFCGQRICPRFYKHQNQLIFNDYENKIYIHWNVLIKESTIKYDEFARLYVDETINKKYAILYIATTTKHYRFNKYLSNIENAKEFVSKVNNWWNVDRLQEKEKIYNNNHIINIQQKKEEKKEEKIIKTEQEIYLENEEGLNKLIKKLKYKSFKEIDIENACKLKEFFESKYRGKMIEEYQTIKINLENIKKSVNNGDNNDISKELIFKNEDKYISSALLLKFETLHQLIEKRKMNKIQMMINENKKNKIIFDDDDDDKNEEQKVDTLEDEEEANGRNQSF